MHLVHYLYLAHCAPHPARHLEAVCRRMYGRLGGCAVVAIRSERVQSVCVQPLRPRGCKGMHIASFCKETDLTACPRLLMREGAAIVDATCCVYVHVNMRWCNM